MYLRNLAICLALSSGFSLAQKAENCALANALDYDSYSALTLKDWSEIGQNMHAVQWAKCRSKLLDTRLEKHNKLRIRIKELRQHYKQLRELEGSFMYMRFGGGTMYSHAIPRRFPKVEDELANLSQLALSRAGGKQDAYYQKIILDAQKSQKEYIQNLKSYRHEQDDGIYDPKRWKLFIKQYEQTSQDVMSILGKRGDAATALGYYIMTSRLSGYGVD